jgi:chitinase
MLLAAGFCRVFSRSRYWRTAAIVCCFCGVWSGSFAQEIGKRIVGYYPSWAIYARNYHVPNIPANLVTHINYAFANIQNGEIALGDYYADVDKYYPGDSWDNDSLRGCFHQLQLLKRAYPHLKTLISVGGWTWSGQFSDVALTEATRLRFARSCTRFVAHYQFDGVDIDWEYPVSGGLQPGRPEDRQNFTRLLRALRLQLDSLTQIQQRPYLLTVAAPASPARIANIEVETVHPLLDFLNVMTYDFHAAWGSDADAITHFNAPLYTTPEDPLIEPYHSQFNCAAAIENYLTSGVPPEKITFGLPFYGHGYGNVDTANHGLFVSYAGTSPTGTWEAGSYDFWDLTANYFNRNGYSQFRHPAAAVPWLFNPQERVMISFDDSFSIAAKGRYIQQTELGGAMFWEFSGDHDHVLLQSIYQALLCPPSRTVTAFLTQDCASIQLRFFAPDTGQYQFWASTSRSNDGDPNGGDDPQWTLAGHMTCLQAGMTAWIDPAPIASYKNYLVIHQCGETSR